MNAKKIFTEHELAIMKVLWGAKEPLARPQILHRMVNQELNPASFHFAMNSLIEKGYAEVSGYERCGTNYGRTYASKRTRGDFLLNMICDTQPDGAEPEGITDLMAAFVERAQIDKKTISELEKMLAERRRKLEEAEQGVKPKMEE